MVISCIAPRDSENSAVKPMIPQPTKEVTTITTSPSMTKLCGDVKDFVKIGENVTVTCFGGSECQFKCSNPNTFPTKNGVRCRKGKFQPANLRNEQVDCSLDPPCGHPKDFFKYDKNDMDLIYLSSNKKNSLGDAVSYFFK